MVVKNRLRRDPVLLCQLHRPCDSLSILVAPSCCVFNGVAIYLHSCSLSFMSESESGSCSVMSNSLWPHGLLVHGILQARILEWVAFPFSRGSSQPRDWTQVSRTAGGFFTSWATRETIKRIQSGWKLRITSERQTSINRIKAQAKPWQYFREPRVQRVNKGKRCYWPGVPGRPTV